MGTRAEKKLVKEREKLIEAAYYRNGEGVQVNIMDIGKIFDDCTRAAMGTGEELEAAMKAAIAKYRVN